MGKLEGLAPIKKPKPCRVRTLISEMSKEDAKILSEAVEDTKKWTPYTLHFALAARDIHLTEDAIRRHTNKVCSCSRI